MSGRTAKRVALAIALAAVIAAVKFYDLEHYLTLASIKGSHARLENLYTEHPIIVIAAYMAIYISVVSLSIPGAVPMTLVGGALFGLATGALVVSFASTIGATLACAVSRFLLRDWVQQRLGDRLATLNEGVRREGSF
ncbi:MAG TPA: hypothetical protein VK445_12575, partial [Dissulfurispiraceae bacterium]|nr:hypothetical protein [Dissulfurispiraceae bacterium]